MSQLQLVLHCLAGWINRNQQQAVEYLQEEIRVLKEQLGKKPLSKMTNAADWRPRPRNSIPSGSKCRLPW